MSDETKKPETGGESTAPAKDTVTAPQSGAKPKAKTEAKTKSTPKAKTDKPAPGNVMHSAGLDACKRHGLAEVWVTADGQSFGQQGDARAHAANLTDKQLLNVKAE